MSQEMQNIFLAFASYGTRQPETQLDGAKFAKFCKETNLIDKKFTAIDVDIIFSKVKVKGARKISFGEFCAALELIAQKKGVSTDELSSKVLAAGGPKTQATKADFVKFHDDKSTYTGVYANGGPTNVDGNKDLKSLCDRSSADVRGISTNYARQH
ncbi:hypothetical protein WJX72_007506 [[Myrmecia] bisecta]|uniref:P25-alpha family protein n=1 Tax=[Myrmecia] bisecta TaxID=41462 RepID=A0AAW1R7V9_9CHLO